MDVEYFQNGISKIDFKSFELLGNISEKIQSGSTPAGGKFEEQGVLYLKSADFDLFDIRKTQYITEQFHQKLSRSKVQKGDIIIASVGATIGKIGYYNLEEEANINQNVARIRVKDERFIDKFIANFLYSDLGQKQLLGNSTVNAQPYINNQKLSELKIPLLPLEIQNEIIQKMDEALKIKQQKEAEAKDLLASIDEFVLSELGIEYEEVEEKKVFGLSLSELGETKRMDTKNSLPIFRNIEKGIKSSHFSLVEIGTVLENVQRPFLPNNEDSYKYIQLGSIGKENWETQEHLTIKYPDIPSRATQVVQSGEILFSVANPHWGVHITTKEKDNNCAVSSGFMVLDSKEGNNIFFTSLLRTKLFSKYFEKYLTGQGLFTTISKDDLFSIKIPLPPLEIQNKIADEVSMRIEKAKKLESEAKEVYESAKREVESMILES